MRKKLMALFSILGLTGPLSVALPAGAQEKPAGAPAPGTTAPNKPQAQTPREVELKKQQDELARKEAARQLEIKLQKQAEYLKLQKQAEYLKMQKADAEKQAEQNRVKDKWMKNEAAIKGEKSAAEQKIEKDAFTVKLKKNEAESKAERDRQAIKMDKNAAGQAPAATPPQNNQKQ
jgi:hypothetical protein